MEIGHMFFYANSNLSKKLYSYSKILEYTLKNIADMLNELANVILISYPQVELNNTNL